MLAELAAANAAFAVIKQTISNGKELTAAGTAIYDFVSGKDKLKKRLDKKKASIFSSGDGNDLEEFLALEELKQKEQELKEYMIWCGRPGLWHDWIRFQAEARKRRQKEAEERRKKIDKMITIAILTGLLILGTVTLAAIAWLIYAGTR